VVVKDRILALAREVNEGMSLLLSEKTGVYHRFVSSPVDEGNPEGVAVFEALTDFLQPPAANDNQIGPSASGFIRALQSF
jgi:hypothetical protein